MAEMENLRTASLYINNQLLSRGLLRDGSSIDFADPNGDPGGLPAAMARIMSVVNDLILKRDRDAEHRESLSSTLRNLRAETMRQTTDYTRQADKLAEAQRKLDSADSTERAMRLQLKTAEANIHKMKDEMQKMKTLVAQTRSSCANEVRKRDRQIEALKKTVTEAARVRGGARSRDVVTISVTGDFGAEQVALPAGATSDAEYSLRMETNEFLTRLASGLSEENEGLINIVRKTVDSLREMGGLEADLGASTASKGAEDLANELETIMEHLRNILTNPSFVPIEEVEMRDEEISRLRVGFEQMEARWKDAVRMIEGWRRRMGAGGKSVDMEELSVGLRLSPVRIRDLVENDTSRAEAMELSCVQEEDEEEEMQDAPAQRLQSAQHVQHIVSDRRRSPTPEESLNLVQAPAIQEADSIQYDEDDSDISSVYDDDLLDIEELEDAEEPNFEVLQISTATTVSSPPLPERPQFSPLKDSPSAGNKGTTIEEAPRSASRKRGSDFDSAVLEELSFKDSSSSLGEKKRETREPVPPSRMTRLAARKSLEKTVDNFEVAYDSPHFKQGEKTSELRLFSKPSMPKLQGKTKKTTRGGKTEPTASSLQTRTTAVKKAPPAKETSPAPSVSEGPAEKKLRRSVNDSESEADSMMGGAAISKSDSAKSSTNEPPKTIRAAPKFQAPTAASTTRSTPIRPQGARALPRRKPPIIQQSPLNIETITAKLAASEREADAARVRAKLKAARLGKRSDTADAASKKASSTSDDQETASADVPPSSSGSRDPVKRALPTPPRAESPAKPSAMEVETGQQQSTEDRDMPDELAEGGEDQQEQHHKIEVVKRKRDRRLSHATTRRASRRRSTLSPWELEGLISGNVPPSPGKV